MSDDINKLINGFLDDTIGPEEIEEMEARLNRDPEFARRFAGEVFFHNQLHDYWKGVAAGTGELTRDERENRGRGRLTEKITRRVSFLGSIAAMILVCLIGLWWNSAKTANAAVELDRLIRLNDSVRDRTYRIISLDRDIENVADRRPRLDGAILHVRSPDKYVLIRKYQDGSEYITGSDGAESWSVRPEGVVRVSEDPLRFRGPLPGNQYGIPFVDMQSDLIELKSAYELSVGKNVADGLSTVIAVKRSRFFRGPREVEIQYEPRSGLIRRMKFDGMPQARGGPVAVVLELMSTEGQKQGFYSHDSHHDQTRKVIKEIEE